MKDVPKKHHYVPEVYLRHFALSYSGGEIYKLDKKWNQRPKKLNVSQVCYFENFHKIRRDETLEMFKSNDKILPETKFFPYENSSIKKYFDKITSKEKFYLSEFEDLLNVLIHLKKRNPFFKNYLFDKKKSKEIFEEVEAMVKEEIKLIDDPLILEKYEKHFEKHKILREDHDYKNDLFLFGLDFNEKSEVIKEVISDLKKWKATIFYTEPSLPFITSDNPGYTIKLPNMIYNLDFSHVDIFVFPISNLFCLYLERGDFLNGTIYKDITYEKISQEDLIKINHGTFTVANDIILSSSGTQLVIIKELSKNNE